MVNKCMYTCYRCGYKTVQKHNMMKHLYHLKKQCPGTCHDVELTEEIKKAIISNRVYCPPVQVTPPTINQTINNYNQMNNFISKMDPLERLKKYMHHQNIEMVNLEDHVESLYSYQINKLESNSFREFFLDHHAILDIVNKVTEGNNVETMNVIHDSHSDKLRIYNAGAWCCELFDKGIIDVLNTIKQTYLDIYETYLDNKYDASNAFERQCICERIEDYYRFLVCFNLRPECDAFHDHYKDVEENIKMSEVNKTRKQVYDIIKKNSRTSLIELNRKMMDIIQVDEVFKTTILEKLQKSLDNSP